LFGGKDVAQSAQVTAPRTRVRKTDLVQAAARLFSERGYHGTSMQHLGEALGLLRGSLYAHIGSKEELLFEVVDEGAEAFLEQGRAAAGLDDIAAARLEALLVGHIETASKQLEAATVFLNEWRYLGEGRRTIVQEKRDAYEQIVRDIIASGKAKGEFRSDLDVRLAARLVLSAANWTYSWYRPGGDLTPTEIGNSFASMLVDGFRPGIAGTDPQRGTA
jgi:TetR/AcrR family transcriptional regulator, cholesterol catabolism regulator